MKIAIPAIGTKSDVFSYLALAVGLQRAGHMVMIGSHPHMAAMVQSYGIPFTPIGPDVDLAREINRVRERARSWLGAYLGVSRRLTAAMLQASPDIQNLCRDAHLVIVPHTFVGRAEVDLLSKAFITVTAQPTLIPAPLSPRNELEALVDRLGTAIINRLVVEPHNRLRRSLNLPPLDNGVESLLSTRLNLVPFSPVMTPPDPHWSPQNRVVGYWFMTEPEEWQPSAELQVFLLAHEPVIAISLGPFFRNSRRSLRIARRVIEAVKRAGVYAVVQGWEDIQGHLEIPPNILPVSGVPNHWLLPRVKLVLHNGGFGITAAAARSGVPSVVALNRTDTPIWAERLAELGVAPGYIPANHCKPGALADAIRVALCSVEMQKRAAALGEQVRLEGGVRKAVWLIEDVMS